MKNYYTDSGPSVRLCARHLAGALFFRPVNILYLTNFDHLSTERPIALILPLDGRDAMLVPKLEEQHLHLRAPWLEHVRVYADFPRKTPSAAPGGSAYRHGVGKQTARPQIVTGTWIKTVISDLP